MIVDLLFAIASTLVLVVLAVVRPQELCAPRGWYFEGVRPGGETTLRPVPPAGCGEPVPPNDHPCSHGDRTIGARIYCTGGTRPIAVDDRTVRCMRGGWR